MARPKQFDRGQALVKAMYTFWEKGYAATSVPDLLQSMGISRSSLYETFTDKHSLFVEALEHYEKTGEQRFNLLEQASSAKDGLQQFFAHHISMALDSESPGGCFVTNSAISFDLMDQKMRQVISDSFERLNQALLDLLEKAKKSGEIAPDRDLHSLVSLFQSIIHGINVMAKVNKDRKPFDALVKEALSLI